jgi:hypothetical protein
VTVHQACRGPSPSGSLVVSSMLISQVTGVVGPSKREHRRDWNAHLGAGYVILGGGPRGAPIHAGPPHNSSSHLPAEGQHVQGGSS